MKEFLSERKILFTEHDVSRDQTAAREMVARSGQSSVPVTVIEGKPIVGFNRPALEQALAQSARRSFGAAVADARKHTAGKTTGAYVGKVTASSVAAAAHLQAGDIIVEFNRQPVTTATDLERGLAASGGRFRLVFLRHGQRHGAEGKL